MNSFKVHHAIYFLILALCFSCKETPSKPSDTQTTEKEISKIQKVYPNFDNQQLQRYISEFAEKDSLLYDFYKGNNFNLIWGIDSLDIRNINFFSLLLENLDRNGLPNDYLGNIDLKEIAESIESGRETDSLYHRIVDLDFKATRTAIDYITGMHYGFLHPDSLFGELYDIKVQQPDSAFHAQLHEGLKKDIIATLYNSLPTDSVYLSLQKEYRFWDDLANNANKPKVIQAKGYNLSYKKGEKHHNISRLAERLIWSSEYTPDSLDTDTLNQTLSASLLKAINKFRIQNSYPEEDEVGALTIDALNRDANYYLDKLSANMERYRWKRAKKKEDKHIEVNIPAFKLFATQTDSVPVIMRVCVGTVKHKTPMLESNLGYINLNPTWNVPISIAKNEIFPAMRRDPSYMANRNMKLYKGGKEVDYNSFNWKKDKISPHVYFVRQGPGNTNSLGRLKFMFANNFSVYLHDTPSKGTFYRKNRAVSHGCIRLQRPVDLAFFCTRPSDEIYRDEIRFAVDQPVKSKEAKKWRKDEHKPINDIIRIKEKTSLAVDYFTAYMQPADTMLYFADDVYSYDLRILEALGRNKTTKSKIIQEKTENDGVF